jgi:hypothetical protein
MYPVRTQRELNSDSKELLYVGEEAVLLYAFIALRIKWTPLYDPAPVTLNSTLYYQLSVQARLSLLPHAICAQIL